MMKRLMLMFVSILVLAGCSGNDGELSGSYEVSKNNQNDPQAIFTFEDNQVIVDAMSEDEMLQLRERYEILEEDEKTLVEFEKGDFYNTGLGTDKRSYYYDSDNNTLTSTYGDTVLYLEKR